jgi:type VI secretion system protein VasG
MSSTLKTLISKLGADVRQAAERAVNICISNGHFEVEPEHLLLALLEQPKSDVCTILRRSSVSQEILRADLEDELKTLRTGNARQPVFARSLSTLLESAWLISSLHTQDAFIRGGHLLLALLTHPELSQAAKRTSPILGKLPTEELTQHFDRFIHGSSEQPVAPSSDTVIDDGSVKRLKTPALDQFTTNLTQRARDGLVDPVIGRETEIRQVIDILMRRRQNNPILTGEAGVGKTAVAEGLALAIVTNEVPDTLQGVELHALDMGLLQAGASVKGEFENRLKNVIEEVKKSERPIILFIDEAHTLIGAGGMAGQNDAANLLKPALARGELRTLAATTWAEYKKYFEKDAALARRFQMVKVDEPSEEVAASMLRAMVPVLEQHFNIRVLDEAVTEAVRLSNRYITGRQLPDKAVSVLDTACSRVALSQKSRPALIADAQKFLHSLDAESSALSREQSTGSDHSRRLLEVASQREMLVEQIEADSTIWKQESALTGRIHDLLKQVEQAEDSSLSTTGSGKPKAPKKSLLRLELDGALENLALLQGERPLLPLQVSAAVVAQVISAWTGIPLGKMIKDDIRTVRTLREVLEARVIGQSHALDAIAQRVRTARANLESPDKPKGVFMFVGPSGVGKTETALALADALYGGERKLISINMSEYQEAHSVSGLKGSPPGYVGYGEGGVLTEAVRNSPYSVVLLDEVEKAHPDVLEMFYQIFDKGVMDDAEGREISFRNTLIILTSNIASATIMQACLNKTPDEMPDVASLTVAIRPALYQTFKPAFLARMKVIPYYPISDDAFESITRLKLDRIGKRIAANHRAEFFYDDALVDSLIARCTDGDSGARSIDHLIEGSLLPDMADTLLARMADGKGVQRIKVGVNKRGFTYSFK